MKALKLIFSKPEYLAPALVFSSLNVWFGTWAIYIPFVQQKLAISKGDLGLAIFFLSFGVFASFPFVPRVVEKIGVGKATFFGVVWCSVTAILPLLANSYGQLCTALLLFGLGNGLTDISMNTLVTELERRDGVKIMSAAHGFFSLGGVFVGLGSFLAPIIDSPVLHMTISVVLVLLINLIFLKYIFSFQQEQVVKKKGVNFKLLGAFLLLGFIGFITMASEGAIVDWSALYLKEVVSAPEYLWGGGFLGFSIMMTLGRFLGDGLNERIGSYRLIALGAVLAIVGFLMVLTTIAFWTITGYALCGLGFSVMVPELFRIGGKVKDIPSAQGVAFIAGAGYIGFLTGPVMLGYVAESRGLVTTIWLLLFAALFVLGTAVIKGRKAL